MIDYVYCLRTCQDPSDNGCKVTPQRLAVYDMLSHTTEHPTAEMIYQKVKEQYPTMSFATVYKSVEIFSKLVVSKCSTQGGQLPLRCQDE